MKRFVVLFSVYLLLLCLSVPVRGADLRIHFIDVGEGDAILIQTPRDNNVLIDSGNFMTGVRVVEYLRAHEVRELDYFILTHPHLDHIGGSFYIIQRLPVKRLCDNGQDLEMIEPISDVHRWYDEFIRQDQRYYELEAGDTWSVDGVLFEVLWPPSAQILGDFNTNSLVIMIQYKKFRCLLTGDATQDAERELTRIYPDLRAAVLKVGHHGADDASSHKLLDAVSPKIALISVDKDNIRGYPSVDTVNRLKSMAVNVYRTDVHGDVVVNVDDSGAVRVTTNKSIF